MKKILFVCPYPTGLAPSQRFRFEQYVHQLQERGFHVAIEPFFTNKAYSAFYQSGNFLSKIRAIVESYLRRLTLLLRVRPFDLIFIHREATPAGPPVIEWWLARILGKRIIYDFDDAIWTTDKLDESVFTRMIRWRCKVRSICRWSYRISAGNAYLAGFARKFNGHVAINPTTIDTITIHNPGNLDRPTAASVTVGWTGSHSTLRYLDVIVPVLQSLEKKYPHLQTVVIADRDPRLPLGNYTFRPWTAASEISDLRRLDIGLMPLPDDQWARGKCGFKALQYMALEIPAVISPVGVNAEIVEHGNEGFWCRTPSEWFQHIEELILDESARKRMGKSGRRKVIERYSVNANSSNFLSLFE